MSMVHDGATPAGGDEDEVRRDERCALVLAGRPCHDFPELDNLATKVA